MLLEIFAFLAMAGHPQAERCAHADYKPTEEMICVERRGHCAEVTIDGQATVPLTDETIPARFDPMDLDEVCWQVAKPVSTQFRVTAKAGGLYPKFIGKLNEIKINLYSVSEFDPKVDSRLDSMNGIEMKADGSPDGTWQIHSEHPLAAGEYVAVIRIDGEGNWDKQTVLLKLDPKIPPADAVKGSSK